MRVGISVLAQSPRLFDGALSQFLQMGEMLPDLDPETSYYLMAGGADLDFYRQRTRVDRVVNAGISDRGTIARIASEHLLLGPACARHKIDVLFYQSAGGVPMLLPKRTKVVLGVWGGQDPRSIALPWHKRLYRRLVDGGLERASHLIMNSEYTRQLFEARHRDAPAATVIHHGVDDRLFHASTDAAADRATVAALGLDRPYVLAVGNAYPYKLLHVLVAAFARAVEAGQLPHRLAIVASFNMQHNPEGLRYRERLLAILDQHDLRDRVTFLQGVSAATLRALYSMCDLYVQSSASETFGRTVIEAMACGAPVLAADAAATPQVLLDAGRYYAPNDVDGCATAIKELLQDAGQRDELRRRGERRVRCFSRRAEIKAIANVFRAVGGTAPLPV